MGINHYIDNPLLLREQSEFLKNLSHELYFEPQTFSNSGERSTHPTTAPLYQ